MKMTYLKALSGCIAVAVGTLFLNVASANGPDPANLVGVKTCGICHKKDETGNQLAKWQASPHAKAFETLGTPAAKEAGKKAGVDDPQKSGKCLKCHATSHFFTEASVTDKIKPEDGVTCESCHGPGKKYMAKATMEDQAKSIAAGLIHPPTQQCKLCHNEQSPTFKGFDEKSYVEKIAHPNPAAKK
jgi:hypothetical protein